MPQPAARLSDVIHHRHRRDGAELLDRIIAAAHVEEAAGGETVKITAEISAELFATLCLWGGDAAEFEIEPDGDDSDNDDDTRNPATA